VLAALTCLFSALSYAELASSIPIAGSAYTYAYATLGEVVAWIIGWDLILEYGIAVAAVAVGWGGNLNEFLDTAFGIRIPEALAASPEEGGTFNLPAVLIVGAVTALLMKGARETARANTVMVVVKLAVLIFFIVGLTVFDADNLRPFAPTASTGSPPPRRSSSRAQCADLRVTPAAGLHEVFELLESHAHHRDVNAVDGLEFT
jgi:APA family basic amino acid/polyamine antiporter